MLLLRRAVRPGDPGSDQVGLPGGRRDPSDPSPLATALRELEEEVGLSARDLGAVPEFLGTYPAPAFRLRVAAFAAPLGAEAAEPYARDPAEVASVFWFPRSALARAERCGIGPTTAPRYVEGVRYRDHLLWGFTYRLLLQLFSDAVTPSGRLLLASDGTWGKV